MDALELEELRQCMELRVFPATGHQYFEIPLDALCDGVAENELLTLATRQLDKGWRAWDPLIPWVRYRYALAKRAAQFAGVDSDYPIIKIAVETNMGVDTDGLLWEVQTGLAKKDDSDPGFPYACDDPVRVEEFLGFDRAVSLRKLPNDQAKRYETKLNIIFKKPEGEDPVDVDLVVDLGNTRSVGLLLETRTVQDGRQFPFAKRVKPLRVPPPGGQYDEPDRDCEIFPSWLLMHRTTFAAIEPPLNLSQLYEVWESYQSANGTTLHRKKRLLPRSFVEISPAAIGGGKSPDGVSARLAALQIAEGRYYFSSPKRYVWDDAQTGVGGGVVWMQAKNVDDPDKKGGRIAELSGLIRHYMDPGSDDWIEDRVNSDDPFIRNYATRPPNYPRRDTVCWFALSIIEAAYRQINSPRYLRMGGFGGLPRRLRNIMVTYPAAWNFEVKEAYFKQWRRAIDLFAVTHLDERQRLPVTEGGSKPVFVDSQINEAICSQLPIIFSDIQTLLDNPVEWFRLYGGSYGVDDLSTVVMNLDVGGGTTDLTVIRYEMTERGSIQPHLLFQDGRSTAGDELVKKIIERILIPAWINVGEPRRFEEVPEAKAWLSLLFQNPSHHDIVSVEPLAGPKLARITRLLFIPLVNRILSAVSALEYSPNARLEPLEIDLAFQNTVNELNGMALRVVQRLCPGGQRWRGDVFPLKGAKLKFTAEDIEGCVDDVFAEFCRSLGRVAAAFRCHLVVVTGKPSELPRLKQLITEHFPLPRQRIVFARNFPAGSWYPFVSSGVDGTPSGRILDAKTCTVVGAALYMDCLKNPHLTLFPKFEETAGVQDPTGDLTGRYYWGVIKKGKASDFFEAPNLLFEPGEYAASPREQQGRRKTLKKTFRVKVNACRIGRQVMRVKNVNAEPVYSLNVVPEVGMPAAATVTAPFWADVTLRWVLEKGKGESLELLAVAPAEDVPGVAGAKVELKLNTFQDDTFWLDDPRFDIHEKPDSI